MLFVLDDKQIDKSNCIYSNHFIVSAWKLNNINLSNQCSKTSFNDTIKKINEDLLHLFSIGLEKNEENEKNEEITTQNKEVKKSEKKTVYKPNIENNNKKIKNKK